MKELKILWMYHDIMDLYGDKGNMLVLTQRCRKRGIEITIDTCGIGEQKDVREYDLLFLGGGADREQMMLMDDLRARKEQIAQAMAEKSFVFLVCGGYQLFGQYYIAADGSRIDGLGFLITIRIPVPMARAASATSPWTVCSMAAISLLSASRTMADRQNR